MKKRILDNLKRQFAGIGGFSTAEGEDCSSEEEGDGDELGKNRSSDLECSDDEEGLTS